MGTSIRKYIPLFIAIITAAFFAVPSRAQTTVPRYPVDNSANSSAGLFPVDYIERDTIDKALRPRKPLESFYFDDSTRNMSIFAWTVSMADNNITLRDIDTTINEFQIDYVFNKKDVGSASLGNLGGAAIPINYFERPRYRNYSFMQAWDPYLRTPEQILFYNAKLPYTNISYQMSGQRSKEEQVFHAVISQNISPSTSFNIDYNANSMRGQYERQRAIARNFSSNFAHTGKRYAIHGGYIYNVGDIQENGGIQDMRDITDTVYSLTDNIPVRLSRSDGAHNWYKGNTFYWTQSYGIPLRQQRASDDLTLSGIPSIFIGQSFEHTAYRKVYSDALKERTPGSDEPIPYYNVFNLNPNGTNDSVRQAVMDAKLFVQVQPYDRDGILGLITGGMGYERNTYYYAYVPDADIPTHGFGGRSFKNSLYIYGRLDGGFSKYLKWEADAKLYSVGYRSGDMDIGGRIALSAFIKERPLTLDASVRFALREPDFWQQNYYSNHYAWSNRFSQEKSTLISAKFLVPDFGLEVGGNYEMIQDKIYYGLNVVPEQHSGTLSMMGLYLRKDFRLGGFHLNHRVLMQWSSDQTVAPVPLATAYLSYSFGFNVVRNVLFMKIGVDGRYNTQYYAYAYDPALGQFHTQNQVKLGNYPQLDAFISAKWKRARLLFKLQNWNWNMFGNSRYFEVVNYPQNRMMFKIGLSWSFYD